MTQCTVENPYLKEINIGFQNVRRRNTALHFSLNPRVFCHQMNSPVNSFPLPSIFGFDDGSFLLGCLFGFFSLAGNRAPFCSTPMELQSTKEDQDNEMWLITILLGATTAEVAMVSCLSEGKSLQQFFCLFLSSAAKRWQHFIQHRGVSLGTNHRLQLNTLSERKQKKCNF